MPPNYTEQTRQYNLVARAIRFIEASATKQPSLEQIAQAVHLSPYHLQRLFTEWAGISPKRFLQYLTKQHAKKLLLASQSTLHVAESSGLSSTSRLHDLMVTYEAMTPGEMKAGGLGLTIQYGFAESPFGDAIVGWTQRGICHFAFSTTSNEAMFTELASLWPKAAFQNNNSEAHGILKTVFPESPSPGKVHLLLRGSNFQIKVWEALIHTDFGQVITYQQLAERMGSPNAQRAVGSALAANQIGLLIPCHRVIRGTGDTGHYRWGSERKKAMLTWEFAMAQASA